MPTFAPTGEFGEHLCVRSRAVENKCTGDMHERLDIVKKVMQLATLRQRKGGSRVSRSGLTSDEMSHEEERNISCLCTVDQSVAGLIVAFQLTDVLYPFGSRYIYEKCYWPINGVVA